MRGDFIRVWSDTWPAIWEELAVHEDAPPDLFCELYRELAAAFKTPLSIEALADVIDDIEQSTQAFATSYGDDFAGEPALVGFLEEAYDVLDDLAGPALAERYVELLSAFIERFSLRYDLRQPCSLCPTLPGMFSNLIIGLRDFTSSDAHLKSLLEDFENAIRDLHRDSTEYKIKTCIQKQINLVEALGQKCPGVTQNTMGRICDQLNTWPHAKVKEAMKNLYGFACDYPGIRHGGTPTNAVRPIDMRDMVAVSILLAGFVPYLADAYDGDTIYRGR